jgi:predicted flavoprotein YhiN
VIISGGGRCNVTTGIQDVRTVLTKYPRGGKFLSKAMYHFPPAEVYAWFEAHGVPLKNEEDNRVFPQSDNGRDIVGVFEKMFRSSNVEVLLKHSVESVEKNGEEFRLNFKEGGSLDVDAVVLTTGGQAYRHTDQRVMAMLLRWDSGTRSPSLPQA